jgi:hypothetical protein
VTHGAALQGKRRAWPAVFSSAIRLSGRFDALLRHRHAARQVSRSRRNGRGIRFLVHQRRDQHRAQTDAPADRAIHARIGFRIVAAQCFFARDGWSRQGALASIRRQSRSPPRTRNVAVEDLDDRTDGTRRHRDHVRAGGLVQARMSWCGVHDHVSPPGSATIAQFRPFAATPDTRETPHQVDFGIGDGFFRAHATRCKTHSMKNADMIDHAAVSLPRRPHRSMTRITP